MYDILIPLENKDDNLRGKIEEMKRSNIINQNEYKIISICSYCGESIKSEDLEIHKRKCIWKTEQYLHTQENSFILWNIGGYKRSGGLLRKTDDIPWFLQVQSQILVLLKIHAPDFLVLTEHLLPLHLNLREIADFDQFLYNIRRLNYDYYIVTNTQETPMYSGGIIILYKKSNYIPTQISEHNIIHLALMQSNLEEIEHVKSAYIGEGRILMLNCEYFILVGVYAPNTIYNPRRRKIRSKYWDPYFERILDKVKSIYKKPIVCLGDLNHHEETQNLYIYRNMLKKLGLEELNYDLIPVGESRATLDGINVAHRTLNMDKIIIDLELLPNRHKKPYLEVLEKVDFHNIDSHRPIKFILKNKKVKSLRAFRKGIVFQSPESKDQIDDLKRQICLKEMKIMESTEVGENSEMKLSSLLTNDDDLCLICGKLPISNEYMCFQCKSNMCEDCRVGCPNCKIKDICQNCPIYCPICGIHHCHSCFEKCKLNKETIKFSEYIITGKDVNILCNLLKEIPVQNQSIDLDSNPIGPEGAKALANLICKNPIKRLNLGQCGIADKGAEYLANALDKAPTLQILDLCNLYKQYIEFNIFILKKTLTIDKNGLTDMSGEMFLKMIKNSKINLKELRIKENFFSKKMKEKFKRIARTRNIDIIMSD